MHISPIKTTLSLTLFTLATSFDATSLNFCPLRCDGVENVACDCTLHGRRYEDFSNLTLFRKMIVLKHNYLRNLVASGTDNHPFLGESSDMQVMNYDLELEHVARCYAAKYVFYYDKCRRTPKFAKPGQLIWRMRDRASVMEIGRYIDETFFKELELISSSTVDSYDGDTIPDKTNSSRYHHIEDFGRILWWSNTHVGCARVYNPDTFLHRDTYCVICNYGGLEESNVVGKPVYHRGKPCSKCQNGKCESQWARLCGKIDPVPNDMLIMIGPKGLYKSGGKSTSASIFGVWICLSTYVVMIFT